MKKVLFPILLLIALAVAGYFFFLHQKTSPGLDNAPSAASSGNPGSSSSDSEPPKAADQAKPIPPPAPGVRQEFVNFLRSESKAMDSPKVNAEEADKRMAAQAAAMGPEEINYAKDLALNRDVPAGQRIVSAYLLGGAGEKAWPALRDMITAPLVEKGGDPHTEGELKAMQEKAIKLMAIDTLAEQAKRDPRAKGELERAAAEVQDPGIRKYILQKLKELYGR